MSEMHDLPPEPAERDELFVTFANDEWQTAAELGDWLSASGLAPSRLSRARLERVLPAFRALQDLVRAIAERTEDRSSPSPAQVAALNRVLRDGVHYHQLRPLRGQRAFGVTPVGDPLDQARAAVAGSLAHFLAEHDPRRLRRCASETCDWVFIDRSPGRRRRWCDMRVCGNRNKVRRHRQRARNERAAADIASTT
jgi:predicted RNA-binding Zn ribbon-like protein